jgi:hypothetical protein
LVVPIISRMRYCVYFYKKLLSHISKESGIRNPSWYRVWTYMYAMRHKLRRLLDDIRRRNLKKLSENPAPCIFHGVLGNTQNEVGRVQIAMQSLGEDLHGP